MTDTTISAIARQRWDITVALPSASRFRADGWVYDEATGRPCPSRCGGLLHSLRKPYETQGRTQRYVALVCPVCAETWTLSDLGVTSYSDLRVAVDTDRRQAPTARPTPVARQAPPATAVPSALGAPQAPSDRARPVTEGDRRAAVIEAWRSVELFTTQRIPPVGPRLRSVDVRSDTPLPWTSGNLPAPAAGKTWRHTVHGGVHELEAVHALLGEWLQEDPFDVDERTPRGEGAVFCFQVDAEGRFLPDTFVLSSAAWALGRTRSPGPGAPDWLDGFAPASRTVGEAVADLLVASADRQADRTESTGEVPEWPPLDHALLTGISSTVSELIGWPLDPHRWRVQSTAVRVGSDARAPFLNSFVAADLERVARAVRTEAVGGALDAYLSDTDRDGRVDVRAEEQRSQVASRLEPRNVPAGRWPTSTERPLAKSQQLAVNEALGGLGAGAGVLGVNGPPGTGKTTMLRDVIAGIVTRRADRLADLAAPADAFAPGVIGWRTERSGRTFQALVPALTGDEIVIASANNGAVENVTRELPDLGQIDDPWKDTDHFRAAATRLLGAPAWGLVAAVLGNQKNRSEFVHRLWYPSNQGTEDAQEGLRDLLRHEQGAAGPSTWADAVARYRQAKHAEAACREERQAACDAVHRLPGLEEGLVTITATVEAWHAEHERLERETQPLRLAVDECREAHHRCRERVDQHLAARPGVLEKVFSFGAVAREWRTEHGRLARAQDEVTVRLDEAEEALRTAEAAAAAAASELAACRTARKDRAADLAGCREVIERVREKGAVVPDPSAALDPDQDELVAPWLDPEWNRTRSAVFLAALELHRAFLVAGGARTMDLMEAAIAAVRGAVPADADPAAVRAAWQGLFLLVPVVSTTFSSVERMFRGVGRDTIGWLLIDEAGQAAPQSAVGAIWRSRRVVAVGDPLQLEPVVTVLNSTEGRLRANHGVSDRWRVFGGSVQTFVDRQTALGTEVGVGASDRTWVGAPLRVHRRCDDPMFTVVNQAVYGGLMIHGNTGRPDPLTAAGVPRSRWIDVRSGGGTGHWIPEEGDALRHLLAEVIDQRGVPRQDVLVVAPFRAVADGLGSVLPDGVPHGTVHVSQGKQAPVVVIVLGGDPMKPGARNWFAATPNVFNVAVSRAEHRLFVIGDRSAWGTLPYFAGLAAALDQGPGVSAR